MLGLSLVFCLALGRTFASVRADNAEDKAVETTTKIGSAVTGDEQAAGKAGNDEAKKQTIPRPIWLLVDAQTQKRIQAGNAGINNLKRPDVPQRVEIPRESAARIILRDAKQKKDQNSERFPASAKTLAAYNRVFAVKSVSMTLADNTVMKCRALVRMEDAQEVVLEKDIILALAIETDGDQGPETWYCYVSVYEARVAPSADPATQLKDREGFQGTWRITSSQHTDETFLFEEDPRGLKIVVKGDALTYYSRDERSRYEGRFQLDPVTKAIDWSPAYSGIGPPPGATVPFRGIYEFKGDELKIYFHETRWARPNTFDFKEGWLLVLKRNAKDKAPEDEKGAPQDKRVEDKGEDSLSREMRRLEGTWLPVAYQSGGETVDGDNFKKEAWAQFVVTVKDGNWLAKSKEGTLRAAIKIDPTKSPKTMVSTSTVGEGESLTSRSIYDLDGDRLRICQCFEGDQWPKDFSSEGTYLLVYQRSAPVRVGDAEDKAVLAVTKLGGTITHDDEAAGKPVVAVDFTKATTTAKAQKEITDAGLAELKDFTSLRSLSLGGSKVSDKGLKELTHLKSLEALYLYNTGVTDAGLKDLTELGSLRTLDLTATVITDAGLKSLGALNNLQELTLGETRVTDAGLKEIKGLESLQTLWLSNSQVSDAGLRELKELKNLQRLRLDSTKVTGAGLVELADLPALHHLGLSHTPVTDKGLKGLKGFKSLRRLDLDRTLVTDAGLKELKDLKSLQTLSLSGTQVTDLGLDDLKAIGSLLELYVGSTRLTDAGIKRLQSALPELRIIR
jgi:internalin A